MIVTALSDAEPRPRRLALGTFDGVHLGHREVIAGADTVVTFDPHPRTVIDPGGVPPHLLTTLERKIELISELGADELVVIPFDAAFAALTAQEFNDDVLVAGGAVGYAGELLGAPFSMTGEVSHGEKRGRTLGYPTANLVPTRQYVTPAHGVYACRVHLPGGAEPVAAATSIGVRPQFETGLGELVEAFLIDWEGDLYGQVIRIDFLKRLRGEKRFVSVDALLEQMAADVGEARDLAC